MSATTDELDAIVRILTREVRNQTIDACVTVATAHGASPELIAALNRLRAVSDQGQLQ